MKYIICCENGERERERKKMERTKNRKREIGRRDELGFRS